MANTKITALDALTVVAGEDLLAIVDDPTETAATKKIRVDDFQSTWHVGARVYNSGNIAISDNTQTFLTFDSERYDTDTIHDTSTNPGRLTATTAGKYLISASIRFAADNDGYRVFYLRVDGTTFIAIDSKQAVQSTTTEITMQTIYDLAATHYVELAVYHLSGGSLDIVSAGNFSPEFMMHKIG